jgi:hypothetical protein
MQETVNTYRVPVFLCIVLAGYTHVLEGIKARNSAAKKDEAFQVGSAVLMRALE